MRRKIIHIDEEKCNGCGLCAEACHEGAIFMADAKAKLLRDDYCDGLGDCLPACPTGAISFIEREADAYDEKAVEIHLARRKEALHTADAAKNKFEHGKCQGSQVKPFFPKPSAAADSFEKNRHSTYVPAAQGQSMLNQWPIQIKLVPVKAAFFENANLLVAATCSAFSYGGFHEQFIKNRITLIGCPKLDGVDYSEKLEAIIRENNIKSLSIVRMEVPCCSGLEHAAKTALQSSGKFIPWQVVTISTGGQILG